MQVFLSWSGERSRAVALALSEFLPQIMNALEPWISVDIPKGAHWPTELAKQLAKTRIAIICLTPEAAHSPWLLFEAGVLFRGFGQGAVCPYLRGIGPEDVTGPLSLLQVTSATKDDTQQLVRTINKSLGDQARPEKQLCRRRCLQRRPQTQNCHEPRCLHFWGLSRFLILWAGSCLP